VASEHRRRIEDLYEQYQQQRQGLGELQRRMQAIAVTAWSPRRELSVTVGYTGVVSDISFPNSNYRRLAPQELSAMLMRAIADAKEQAAVEAAEILTPLMPAGLNAKDLVSGRYTVEQLVPAEPQFPPVVAEQLARPDA
jgi:DNA-binding protein YbaB